MKKPHLLLLLLLGAVCLTCRRDPPFPLPIPEGTFAHAKLNGVAWDDPICVLNGGGKPKLGLVFIPVVRYRIDADSVANGLRGLHRTFDCSFYTGIGNEVGRILVFLNDFSLGEKPLYDRDTSKTAYRNYIANMAWGGSFGTDGLDGYGVNGGDLDRSEPYSFILDKYDPEAGFVEGHFTLSFPNIGRGANYIPSYITHLRLTEGVFRAKIIKYNRYGVVKE